MELNDALRIALAPSDVWDALQDLALLRASLDNCESFIRLAGGEYALTLMVPLGPLRARYEVRAHVASKNATEPGAPHRALNFKARAEGVGSLRGQIDVTLRPDETGAEQGAQHADRLFGVGHLGRTARGIADPSAGERTARAGLRFLHRVLRGRTGQAWQGRTRTRHAQPSPACVSAADQPGREARRVRPNDHSGGLSGRATSTLFGARASHSVSHREPTPHAMPQWAWAVMILLVAVLMYAAHWFTQS